MTDFRVTPLYRVNELVKAEAARYGVPVIGTELIGLTPAEALFDAAEYYLQIGDFDWRKQVIESRLPEKKEILPEESFQYIIIFSIVKGRWLDVVYSLIKGQ